jgi:hypothetical protein
MELKEYIQIELAGLERGVTRVMNGLTQQELGWRPSSGCNSIGLIFLHMVRFEDTFVQARIQGRPEIWKADKWYQKLGMTEEEAGAHYTVEQVNAFQVPEGKDLLAYYNAVRARTRDYINSAAPGNFDKIISLQHFGDLSVAGIFALLVGHVSQHIGEISYLRGLQRGIDK